MVFVKRDITSRLELFLKTFPVVMIIGPRQCGKTTLVKHALPGFRHFDLERPADFKQVTSDIELFLQEHPHSVCIDEAQRCPELFPVLRYAVDRDPSPGRYVLLGSAGPHLLGTASESLTGRIGILAMSPFTSHELNGIRAWNDRWMWGGLPPVHDQESEAQKLAWLESYVTTVLERDLPGLGVRVPSPRLMKFWTMLTHLQGAMLNVSSLAESMEMSTGAVNNYLDILERSLMIRRLPPLLANVGKRLVKRPKVYIRDSGILHWLAGLRAPRDLDTWAGKGASFEGLVLEEIMTRAELRLSAPRFSFYRTQAGAEVDLVIEEGARIIPVEVKHGASVGQYEVAGLRRCMADLRLSRGYVVLRTDTVRELGNGVTCLPWEGIVRGEVMPWTAATA